MKNDRVKIRCVQIFYKYFYSFQTIITALQAVTTLVAMEGTV